LLYSSAERLRGVRHRKWWPDNLHPNFAADASKCWSWRRKLWKSCEAIEEPLHPGGREDDEDPRGLGPCVLEAVRRAPRHEDEGPRWCPVQPVIHSEAEATFEDIPGLVLARMGVQGRAVTGSDHVLEQGQLSPVCVPRSLKVSGPPAGPWILSPSSGPTVHAIACFICLVSASVIETCVTVSLSVGAEQARSVPEGP
jgi:hypothetical protein